MFEDQMEILNASLNNLTTTKRTIENLKTLNNGDEILVPVGGMINIKANIKETQKVLLYVNDDVVIEKDLDGSLEFIEELIEQHKEQISSIGQQLQQIDMNLQALSQSVQGSLRQP